MTCYSRATRPVSSAGLAIAVLIACLLAATHLNTLSAQTPARAISAVIPLIRFAGGDSAVGLPTSTPDSTLFEISGLLAVSSREVVDSLQRIALVPLGVKTEWGCGDGGTTSDVIDRARCVLGSYTHYVELREFVAHDSAAQVIVFVIHAVGPTRNRGVRESVVGALGRVVGRGTATKGPISMKRYVAHLTLTATGDWVVRDLVKPALPRHSIVPDSSTRRP